MGRKVKLPSGAELDVDISEFENSKDLYMIMAEECVELKLDPTVQVHDVNLYKSVLLKMLSSKKIEAALWKCMNRSTYKGARITQDTFEPAAARGDYLTVCFEVAVENVGPFVRPLFARFADMFQNFMSRLRSISEKTPS